MDDPPQATIPRRFAPDGSYSISEITVALSDTSGSAPLATRSTVAALRRARSVGVTGFDLTGLTSYEWGAEMLREAFRAPDPDLVVILGPLGADASRRPPASGEPSPEADLRSAIDPMRERLGGVGRWIVDWTPSAREPSPPPPPISALARLRTERTIVDYALPIAQNDVSEATRPDTPPSLLSAPLSLLDTGTVNAFRRSASVRRSEVIARDIFAGGALDGRLVGTSPLEQGPTHPPETLAELHARLDPVLKLGFLTNGRRRTLPQAALSFALQWPWVLSAVVPLPSVERWPTLIGRPLGPPLDARELHRLGVEEAPAGDGLPPSVR